MQNGVFWWRGMLIILMGVGLYIMFQSLNNYHYSQKEAGIESALEPSALNQSLPPAPVSLSDDYCSRLRQYVPQTDEGALEWALRISTGEHLIERIRILRLDCGETDQPIYGYYVSNEKYHTAVEVIIPPNGFIHLEPEYFAEIKSGRVVYKGEVTKQGPGYYIHGEQKDVFPPGVVKGQAMVVSFLEYLIQ